LLDFKFLQKYEKTMRLKSGEQGMALNFVKQGKGKRNNGKLE
jgi:hypothetical protein